MSKKHRAKKGKARKGPKGQHRARVKPEFSPDAMKADPGSGEPQIEGSGEHHAPAAMNQRAVLNLQQQLGNAQVGRILTKPGENKRVAAGGKTAVQLQEPGTNQKGGGAPQGIPTALARQMAYSAMVLKNVQPLAQEKKTKLDQVLRQAPTYRKIKKRDACRKEIEKIKRKLQAFGPPLTADSRKKLQSRLSALTGHVERLDREIKSELAAFGVSETSLVYQIMYWPRIWIERAKQITYTMLDQNKRTVEGEKARYSMEAGPPDAGGLVTADRHLAGLTGELKLMMARMKGLEAQRKNYEAQVHGLYYESRPKPQAGGVGLPVEGLLDLEKQIETLKKQIWEKGVVLRRQHAQYAKKNTVLLFPHYFPGVFEKAGPADIARITGGWSQQILDNIEKTRENIRDDTLKVWHLKDVPALTFQNLGIPKKSILGEAVKSYTGGQDSAEEALRVARMVLAVTAGIASAFYTGGVSLMFALAAGGVGLLDFLDSLKKYQAESAAQQVHFDPVLADISKNEPELLWLVLDVVGMGLDAIQVVKLLRIPARVMMRTGKSAGFAAEVRRLVPDEKAARQLIEKAERQMAAHRLGPFTPEEMKTFSQMREFTHREMLEFFADTYRRPGPPIKNYKLHKTLEDFEFSYLWRSGEKPEPGLRGFFSPESGVMHLPPGATLDDIMHEALEWVAKQTGTQAKVGGFLREGIVEWLTKRGLKMKTTFTYVDNVHFVEWLASKVGSDIIERAFLHGEWHLLDTALLLKLGQQTSVDEFYRLLRRVGADGEGIEMAYAAKNMLDRLSAPLHL